MVFLLTSLNIYYILDPNLSALPEPQEDESATVKTERLKHEEDEMLYQGYILNTLIARVQRRGKYFHPQNVSNVANVGRQGILVFY